jgi:hypothetical protein
MDGITQAFVSTADPKLLAFPTRPGNPTLVRIGAGNDNGGGNNNVVWALLSDGYLLVMGNGAPDGVGGQSWSFNEASLAASIL